MPVLSSTLRETDDFGFIRKEKFITERGFELTIEPMPSGLYRIVAVSGGKTPKICDSLYTSHMKARSALMKYVEESDRMGYAVHPGKPETQPPPTKSPRKGKNQQ